MNAIKKARGFTLIELLVVIGIIAVLAAIVIIAVNPARQFAQARNSQRSSDVNTILNAIGQDIADNKGTFGGVCGNILPTPTASSTVDIAGGTGINLSCLTPTYVPSLPSDPTLGTATTTGYWVSVNSIGRVMICAPGAVETAITGSTAICSIR